MSFSFQDMMYMIYLCILNLYNLKTALKSYAPFSLLTCVIYYMCNILYIHSVNIIIKLIGKIHYSRIDSNITRPYSNYHQLTNYSLIITVVIINIGKQLIQLLFFIDQFLLMIDYIFS